jgi:hypothetical protein
MKTKHLLLALFLPHIVGCSTGNPRSTNARTNLAVAAITAATPQIELEARYSGFDPKLFSAVDSNLVKGDNPNVPLVAPRVTTRPGQPCVIELIREVKVPGASTPIWAGITLSVTPTIENGRIRLIGKSTVRQLLDPGTEQPLGSVSFTTRETFFGGLTQKGKPVTLKVGDGPRDGAKITLVAKLINSDGQPQ